MPTSLLKILMTESPRKLLDAHWNLVGQVRAPAAQPHRFDDAPSMEVVSAIAHEEVVCATATTPSEVCFLQ